MTDPQNNNQQAPSTALTVALVCAVIVPQVGIGLSVPSLPVMAEAFQIPVAAAQGTLIVYMAGYALSMLLSGLLSDRFGPRRVQLFGLALAGVAAMLAALADHVSFFYFVRFIQALGGCMGTVTARLIVSTEYETRHRMKILTTLASAIAVMPCLSPIAGSVLLAYGGWRGVFVANSLIAFGVLLFFAVASRWIMPHRACFTPLSSVFGIYRRNMLMPRFMYYATAISLVWMSYFAFVSCSSGPLQIDLALSSFHYGIVLGFSATGYVTGSMVARRMSRNRDIDDIIRLASFSGLAGSVLFVGFSGFVSTSVLFIIVPALIVFFSVGMIIPATQAGLLQYVTRDMGVSSGLFFFLQMIAGAAYAAVGNQFLNMTPQSLAIMVALPVLFLPVVRYGFITHLHRLEQLRQESAVKSEV